MWRFQIGVRYGVLIVVRGTEVWGFGKEKSEEEDVNGKKAK